MRFTHKCLFSALLFIISTASGATDLSTPQSFKDKSDEAKILGKDEFSRLSHIRSTRGHRNSSIVELDALAINSTTINLNIDPQKKISLYQGKRNAISGGKISWEGRSADGSSSTLLSDNGKIYGVIRNQGHVYEIKHLSGKFHVITEVDFFDLPPEHPTNQSWGAKDMELKKSPGSKSDAVPVSPSTTTADSSGADSANAPTVDVLVAYTPQAAAFFGNVNNAALTAINLMNTSFTDSQANLKVNLVGVMPVKGDYANSNMALNAFIQMPDVKTQRNNLKADVVVMIAHFSDSCGLANAIMAKPDTAFAVVADGCVLGNYSLAHEIGHLMGARHNVQEDSTNTPFAYGHGWWHIYPVDNSAGSPCWHTIMSYPVQNGCYQDPRIGYWSNPKVSHNGWTGDANANNAAVLNITGGTVSHFSDALFLKSISPAMAAMVLFDN